MPRRTSVVDRTPVRVVLVTLDGHLGSAAERARAALARELPGLTLSFHAAADWADDAAALERCRVDIARGDIVLVTMLFMEDHIQPILPDLEARRDHCDAMIACMAAGEVMRLTRMGGFRMDRSQGGALGLLRRLRGSSKPGTSDGARQLAMLRRIPRFLRFIPGMAQDVRAYFLTMQYWLAASDENLAHLVRFLVGRYAAGERAGLQDIAAAPAPVDYPEVGVYHPRLPGRIAADARRLPAPPGECRGTVGLLLMRSYVLAGDAAHYDAVIASLEARGYRVLPAFAAGLDARPAVEAFFLQDGQPCVDAVVSLTGFSLVGGPAYNDARAAEELLASLDVPYLAGQAVEFQTLEQWQGSVRGLLPLEATMMVAIPELDGATGPMVFGGRAAAGGPGRRDMAPDPERVAMLAGRVDRLVRLRATPRAQRRVAVVLFSFPPNAGNAGTAAYLSVFPSLWNTLKALREDGYTVDLPEDAEALRRRVIEGNATQFGAHANVHERIGADDHVRQEPWLEEIEAQWGPAPGRQQSDGASLFVLGERFGNVFVGLQPAFGSEGDPMRLLFDGSFAPTHAFCAFYRYLRETFAADAVLHFGTHGALEFMPGKQAGLSGRCWPDRLIGDLPSLYLYAANNPSEGTLAKRRAAATLVSYLTPPVTQAGLYNDLLDLKSSLERWRGTAPEEQAETERAGLLELIHSQAQALDLEGAGGGEPADAGAWVAALAARLRELEATLIPHGLHVVGEAVSPDQRLDWLRAMAEAEGAGEVPEPVLQALARGEPARAALRGAGLDCAPEAAERLEPLVRSARLLGESPEIPAILRALDGRYLRPAPGGDVLRNPAVLPTGRNLHGFDPFRLPSRFAVADGARQAERLLARHAADGNGLPELVALVLWGTDNLKNEGGPIGQALALIGARARFDGYGRLAGASLIPLEELGRPRVDVMITLSGIFRDLLPLQTRMLAEAAYLAASADEPLARNPVRRHALAYQQAHDCDLETAALRVFSNADGAYGSNVGQLVDSGCWEDDGELAASYARRKCYAYGRSGQPVRQAELLQSILGGVQLAYQNLESVELGVTTVDHYFDTLGGISRAVTTARGGEVPVYIGDQTRGGEGQVRTLADQVALETRTRMLNPKWYEGMLEHGYEGVRQIEVHITNTLGWSATTGAVAPWVYQRLTQTFVLDAAMRERLAKLNPTASARVAGRLLEAQERRYWAPDEAMLEALREAGEELEDRLEGVGEGVAA